jgi:hypothetical protein
MDNTQNETDQHLTIDEWIEQIWEEIFENEGIDKSKFFQFMYDHSPVIKEQSDRSE